MDEIKSSLSTYIAIPFIIWLISVGKKVVGGLINHSSQMSDILLKQKEVQSLSEIESKRVSGLFDQLDKNLKNSQDYLEKQVKNLEEGFSMVVSSRGELENIKERFLKIEKLNEKQFEIMQQFNERLKFLEKK